MADASSAAAWRGYWREDRLSACMPDDAGANAAIEQHWRSLFEAVEPGARVLDVATGNGVLLLWASEVAPVDATLIGVDLADIDPQRFLSSHGDSLRAVQFLGNTPAEALPFDDGSFDLLVSQYGLEYAELGAALAESARVLCSGGELHWLAHSADSAVAAQGRRQLRELTLLLDPEGPFTAMRAFLEAQRSAAAVKRATRRLTEALRRAQDYCERHPEAALLRQLCGGILDTANNLPRYHPDDVDHWLEDNRRRLKAQRQRMLDLQRARLDEARLEQLRALLGMAPWREFSCELLRGGGQDAELGIVIHARRA
ncbi:MAG: class I SAM-dependent methyltransferase [Halieaceae bacterium]|nr:class I SAM-dependent methyltransferase [Halieaceae bacterium]